MVLIYSFQLNSLYAIYEGMVPVFLVHFVPLLFQPISGTKFFIIQFRAQDGLKTDLIKCIAQDSMGFIWVGTDDGLLRYDGITFKSYPNATTSGYIKDFITTKQKRLLAIHDFGVVEIIPGIENADFKVILEVKRTLTEDALWYPKGGFEDDRGALWFAEAQSVVKFNPNGKWSRFHFGPEDNSNNFVRSFQIANLNTDSVLVASYTGSFYLYNYESDSLSSIQVDQKHDGIFVIKNINSKLYMGTLFGLYELVLDGNMLITKKIFGSRVLSDIVPVDDQTMLVVNENDSPYLLDISTSTINGTPILEDKIASNQVFRSQDGSVWISTTSRGILQLSIPLFQNIYLDERDLYVECIVKHPDSGALYVLIKDFIWKVDPKTKKSKRVFYEKEAYLLTAQFLNDDLWVSNEFQIQQIKNGRVVRRIDLSEYGRYIFAMEFDQEGYLWVSQQGAEGLKRVDLATGSFQSFDSSKGLPKEITDLTITEKGIYAVSPGTQEYLFFKAHSQETFRSIGHPLPDPIQGDFFMEDILLLDDTLWMASNQGLLRHTENDIERVSFGANFDDFWVKSLAFDGEYLWFGNSIGLFRYDRKSGEYSQFNEKSGMPLNSVNEEGIIISDNKVWVGTASGLAMMPNLKQFRKTKKPVFVGLRVDGSEMSLQNEKLRVPYDSYLELSFVSLSFPSDEIQYSYRLVGEGNEWSEPSIENYAILTQLGLGEVSVEVRAKKFGNFEWSDPTILNFRVLPPFYQTIPFYTDIVLGALALVILAMLGTRYVLRRRQELLATIVDERTKELNTYKDRLEILVDERTKELRDAMDKLHDAQDQLVQSEKMASLGILTAGVAHEINNPMNFLQGGLYGIQNILKKGNVEDKKEELTQLSEGMQEGVNRITKIVAGLSRFSRTDQEAKTPCKIHDILDNCLLILHHEIKNKVEVKKDFEEESVEIEGHEGNLHQLFSNLIVNAVHAISEKGEIIISTKKKKNKIEVSIKDNGVGIPKKNLSKLMDPFFTTKEPGIGTGLGLYISHQIVEDHDGKLSFDSKLVKERLFLLILK